MHSNPEDKDAIDPNKGQIKRMLTFQAAIIVRTRKKKKSRILKKIIPERNISHPQAKLVATNPNKETEQIKIDPEQTDLIFVEDKL